MAGQIAYEKKKAAQRAIAMQKGMKQAKALYSYTQQHGYGKDQVSTDPLSTLVPRLPLAPLHGQPPPFSCAYAFFVFLSFPCGLALSWSDRLHQILLFSVACAGWN